MLKYSFSEVEHRKAVTLIDRDAKGQRGISEIPLVPKHDLHVLEGYMDVILMEVQLISLRFDN